jgi:hypothetical protein
MPILADNLGLAACSLSFATAIDDAQTGPDGALGIIVVRLWPAEVSHHAVTKILGNMTPSRWIASVTAKWYEARISRHSSGSSRAAISVEPTRSQQNR